MNYELCIVHYALPLSGLKGAGQRQQLVVEGAGHTLVSVIVRMQPVGLCVIEILCVSVV